MAVTVAVAQAEAQTDTEADTEAETGADIGDVRMSATSSTKSPTATWLQGQR